jgi:hypothetical protein
VASLRQSPPEVTVQRRAVRLLGTAALLLGAFMILIALGVFLTQGSQVRVTATVLSERCHRQYDLATSSDETRCDASVRFATRSGRVITTMVTDAFPYEFSHRPGRPTTIQLRYDTSDPASPYKQSNYMSVGVFLLLLGIGAVAVTAGILWVVNAERLAENAVRRRMRSGPRPTWPGA